MRITIQLLFVQPNSVPILNRYNKYRKQHNIQPSYPDSDSILCLSIIIPCKCIHAKSLQSLSIQTLCYPMDLPFPSLSFYFLEDHVIHKAKYFAIIFTVFTALPFHLKIYCLEKIATPSQGDDSCILSEFCCCQRIILISVNKFKD